MYVEHLRIPVGAGSLHVERTGRGGPAVVLLHGFGTCAFLWRRLAPALANAGYMAIAIDLLGHGESDRPEDAAYHLAAQADHVARAMAALRLSSAALVGQDIGGLVALVLAAGPRFTVDGVALLSPPDPDDLPGSDIRALQRGSALIALSANLLFGAQPALAPLLRAGVAEPANMPDLLVARYLAPFVGTDGLAQLLLRSAAVEFTVESRARLGEVAAPVLVLNGEADTGRPILNWSSLLPASHVDEDTVTGSGRLIPEDAPTALFDQLASWLARITGRSTKTGTGASPLQG